MDKSIALPNRARVGRLLWLLFPWMLVALVILFYPFRFAFELDADEGVNLMKSLLVNQGAELYTDVWSDQPPVLTYLIAALFQIVGACGQSDHSRGHDDATQGDLVHATHRPSPER